MKREMQHNSDDYNKSLKYRFTKSTCVIQCSEFIAFCAFSSRNAAAGRKRDREKEREREKRKKE